MGFLNLLDITWTVLLGSVYLFLDHSDMLFLLLGAFCEASQSSGHVFRLLMHFLGFLSLLGVFFIFWVRFLAS